MYSADVFALPSNGNRARGLTWIHAISERGAQADFSELKYSVPARLDIPAPASMDDGRQSSKLIRALPALLQGNGAFRDLGMHLERWARERFDDPASIIEYAAEQRHSLEQRAAGTGDMASTPCRLRGQLP